jgi:hypothetical protein
MNFLMYVEPSGAGRINIVSSETTDLDCGCGPGSRMLVFDKLQAVASSGYKFSHFIITITNYPGGDTSEMRSSSAHLAMYTADLSDHSCEDPPYISGFMVTSLIAVFVERPESEDSDSGDPSSEDSSSGAPVPGESSESDSEPESSESSESLDTDGPIVRDDGSGCIVRSGDLIVRA